MLINKRLAFRITKLIHFEHRKSNIVNLKHTPSPSVEGNVQCYLHELLHFQIGTF